MTAGKWDKRQLRVSWETRGLDLPFKKKTYCRGWELILSQTSEGRGLCKGLGNLEKRLCSLWKSVQLPGEMELGGSREATGRGGGCQCSKYYRHCNVPCKQPLPRTIRAIPGSDREGPLLQCNVTLLLGARLAERPTFPGGQNESCDALQRRRKQVREIPRPERRTQQPAGASEPQLPRPHRALAQQPRRPVRLVQENVLGGCAPWQRGGAALFGSSIPGCPGPAPSQTLCPSPHQSNEMTN